MNKKRLKLYDSSIAIVLDSKLKKDIRKIAFSNKMTMSAYIRLLITIGNKVYKNTHLLKQLRQSDQELEKIFGGIIND